MLFLFKNERERERNKKKEKKEKEDNKGGRREIGFRSSCIKGKEKVLRGFLSLKINQELLSIFLFLSLPLSPLSSSLSLPPSVFSSV